MDLRLFLIRHGEINQTSEHRLYGHTDVRLTEQGKAQAQWVADTLSQAEIAAVYSSDLSRAADTARIIADKRKVPINTLLTLREINMGRWEGKSFAEINKDQEHLVTQLFRTPSAFRYPDGESFTEFESRVRSTLTSIRASHTNKAIAIVAHGGVCRMILGQVLQLAPRNWLRLTQDYGCINVIDWYEGAPIIKTVNYTSSLV